MIALSLLKKKKYSWRDGKSIIFDDTNIHYVENNTDEHRIILFCDFDRPMSDIGKMVNQYNTTTYGYLTSRKN